jgi:type 1 fimbria pilin
MNKGKTLAALAAVAMMSSVSASASSFDVKVTDKDGSDLCRGSVWLKPGEENAFSNTTLTPYTASIYQMPNKPPVPETAKYETGNAIKIALDTTTGGTDKINVKWIYTKLDSMAHLPFSGDPSGQKVDLPQLSTRNINKTLNLRIGETVKISTGKPTDQGLALTITRTE